MMGRFPQWLGKRHVRPDGVAHALRGVLVGSPAHNVFSSSGSDAVSGAMSLPPATARVRNTITVPLFSVCYVVCVSISDYMT